MKPRWLLDSANQFAQRGWPFGRRNLFLLGHMRSYSSVLSHIEMGLTLSPVAWHRDFELVARYYETRLAGLLRLTETLRGRARERDCSLTAPAVDHSFAECLRLLVCGDSQELPGDHGGHRLGRKRRAGDEVMSEKMSGRGAPLGRTYVPAQRAKTTLVRAQSAT